MLLLLGVSKSRQALAIYICGSSLHNFLLIKNILCIYMYAMQAGLLFFLSVFWGFYPLFSAVFMFPQERAMLAKERSIDMYKLSAYFLAKNTSDVPLEFIMPVVFMVIVYFMVGLKLQFSAFSLTMLTVFLSVLAAQVSL